MIKTLLHVNTLFFIQASFAFFTTEGLEFMNILTYGGRDHGRYPYSIYGKEVLRFLTFVIPLALFQYYLLLYLLDMEQSVFFMLIPLFGLVFIIPGYIFFRFGLQQFKSTGSWNNIKTLIKSRTSAISKGKASRHTKLRSTSLFCPPPVVKDILLIRYLTKSNRVWITECG